MTAEFLKWLWVSPSKAREIGCTHYARSFGIIPGFYGEEGMDALWLPRSSLLVPIENLLAFLWVTLREMRGEEPDFMFQIRGTLPPSPERNTNKTEMSESHE
jgi:hypothetical protein